MPIEIPTFTELDNEAFDDDLFDARFDWWPALVVCELVFFVDDVVVENWYLFVVVCLKVCCELVFGELVVDDAKENLDWCCKVFYHIKSYTIFGA